MNGDENLNKLVVNNDVMSHVLKMFESNRAKDNLLMSAILDLFEYIKKQNMKKIISYLVKWLIFTKYVFEKIIEK